MIAVWAVNNSSRSILGFAECRQSKMLIKLILRLDQSFDLFIMQMFLTQWMKALQGGDERSTGWLGKNQTDQKMSRLAVEKFSNLRYGVEVQRGFHCVAVAGVVVHPHQTTPDVDEHR